MNSDILSGSCYFYPRSPCGERPGTACMGNQEPYAYFYPRSPCGERRERGLQDHSSTDISIHALLAESDVTVLAVLVTGQDISIHALLAESDSTPYFFCTVPRYFYPRSPCGERPGG